MVGEGVVRILSRALEEGPLTRIFEKHTDDEELTNSEHLSLTMTCILDLGPTSTPVES